MILLLTICQFLLFGASRSDFQYRAEIIGKAGGGKIYAVRLPREILSQINPKGTNIRIVDDQGKQISYAYAPPIGEKGGKAFFSFRVINHTQNGESEELIVDKPLPVGSYDYLSLETGANDFSREVILQGKRLDGSWEEISKSSVFDFNPQRPWSRLEMDIGELSLGTLKLTLKTLPEMSGLLDGIDLEQLAHNRKPLTSLRIHGGTRGEKRLPDEENFAVGKMAEVSQKSKDSWFLIEPMDVSVMALDFSFEGEGFTRKVELWGSPKRDLSRTKVLTEGHFYRIPGMESSQSKIFVPESQEKFLYLRILNKGFEPIRPTDVTVTWRPKRIYFTAEEGRKYALLFAPNVDTDKDSLGLEGYGPDKIPLLTLLPSDKNPEFGVGPIKPPEVVVRFWRWAFAAVAVLVIVGMFVAVKRVRK